MSAQPDLCHTCSETTLLVFSSPEPSGSQGELIVYPCSVVRPSVVRPSVRLSVVRRPPFSKIFFSETAWPIKAKFYMKHLWEGGTNVHINNPGHMTKMAAMPIYGKNPSKIFFSGTTGPISTKLGMKHRCLKYYNVYINHDLAVTLTYFTARST